MEGFGRHHPYSQQPACVMRSHPNAQISWWNGSAGVGIIEPRDMKPEKSQNQKSKFPSKVVFLQGEIITKLNFLQDIPSKYPDQTSGLHKKVGGPVGNRTNHGPAGPHTDGAALRLDHSGPTAHTCGSVASSHKNRYVVAHTSLRTRWPL